MTIASLPAIQACRPTWNKGRIVGRKCPSLPKHVWAIRVRLEIANNARDLALFNLAIDSKLRGCDLIKLRVADVYAARQVKDRAAIIQSKTQKPVRFEIAGGTRTSLVAWLDDPMITVRSTSGPDASTRGCTSRRPSTRGSSETGFRRSAWSRARTASIRCAERKSP